MGSSNEGHVPGRRQRLAEGWRLVTDPDNGGIAAGWAAEPPDGGVPAFVPGALQQSAPGYHGVVWYFLRFEARVDLDPSHRALLRFDAADYYAEVWLDGVRLGEHEGGEAPFELDATDVLAAGDGEHLLSVRVVNPGTEPVDGMTIGVVPHGIKSDPYVVGLGWNTGGLTGGVELIAVPRPGLGDVVVRPDRATGEVGVEVEVLASDAPEGLRLDVTIAPDAAGSGAVQQRASQAAGAGAHALRLALDEPRDWSPEDPFLYRVTVSLAHGARLLDQRTVRCGFRDFRVGSDGWFRLNGKRIWLRMSHTANHFPIGQRLPHEIDLARRDMVYAKAAGFNCVRFMGTARPEQLDVADDIGLLVFEESFADWGGLLEDSPQMAERMDRVVGEMIVRDRNHPSIVMWGLLNEVRDDHGFRHAVSMLPRLRELDPTRVVMLDSGRWDGVLGIGSVANPGSVEWEHLWGAEAPDAEPVEGINIDVTNVDHDKILQRGVTTSYVEGAGDVHLYVRMPCDRHAIAALRGIGRGTKPVLLSEFGTGSLLNVARVLRRFEQAGARDDLEDFALYRQIGEQLDRDWERYGLGEVFPAPEDLARRSEELHAVRRRRDFDLIRSNPQLCGYGLTGLVDQVMAAEGLWTTWRELKPGALSAVSEGFAAVRWCLLPSREHVAVGERFTLEVVLANDGALAPGSYPATVMVHGPGGAAWREDVEVLVPEPGADGLGPLAVPVLERELVLEGPPGRYAIAATMTRGGAPAAGRGELWVSEPARLAAPVAVQPIGCSTALRAHLTQLGCELREDGLAYAPAVVVVGDDAGAIDDDVWAALLDAVERGSVAVVLDPVVLRRGEEPLGRLPVARPGRLERPHNWLYHREDVAKAHPVFDGLQAPGVLEWSHWGQTLPDYLLADHEADEVYAVGIFPGDVLFTQGYSSGVSLALHRLGAGALLLSTFRIVPELGEEPAAQRLLANLVRYAAASLPRT